MSWEPKLKLSPLATLVILWASLVIHKSLHISVILQTKRYCNNLFMYLFQMLDQKFLEGRTVSSFLYPWHMDLVRKCVNDLISGMERPVIQCSPQRCHEPFGTWYSESSSWVNVWEDTKFFLTSQQTFSSPNINPLFHSTEDLKEYWLIFGTKHTDVPTYVLILLL